MKKSIFLIDIDNKNVINTISEHLKGYAFIVTAFEYDFDEDSLNFKITILYPLLNLL